MTPAERNQYKTRADRVQEIVRDIEALDSEKKPLSLFVHDSFRLSYPNRQWQSTHLLVRALKLGIDTLIAQLEQELADIDKPKVVNIPQFSVVKPSALEMAASVQAKAQPCLHISRDMLDNCLECGAKAADLGNGNLSERQIARYGILSHDHNRSPYNAGLGRIAEAAP